MVSLEGRLNGLVAALGSILPVYVVFRCGLYIATWRCTPFGVQSDRGKCELEDVHAVASMI